MGQLDNVELRLAPLSDRVVFARFGKDPQVALETKDAQSSFLQMIVQFTCGDMPAPGESAMREFGGGDEQFEVTVRRKDRWEIEE